MEPIIGQYKNYWKQLRYVISFVKVTRIYFYGRKIDSENTNLRNKYDFFEYRSKCKKMEFEVGEVKYRFHGKGCTVFNQENVIEWDF